MTDETPRTKVFALYKSGKPLQVLRDKYVILDHIPERIEVKVTQIDEHYEIRYVDPSELEENTQEVKYMDGGVEKTTRMTDAQLNHASFMGGIGDEVWD